MGEVKTNNGVITKFINNLKTKRSWQIILAILFGLVMAGFIYDARAGSIDIFVGGVADNNCINTSGTVVKETESTNKRNFGVCQIDNGTYLPELYRFGQGNVNNQIGGYLEAIQAMRNRGFNSIDACAQIRSVSGQSTVRLKSLGGSESRDVVLSGTNYESICIEARIDGASNQSYQIQKVSGSFRVATILFSGYTRVAPPVDADININQNNIVRQINPDIYGINAPFWLGWWMKDANNLKLAEELGSKLIRLPGGSASNGYNWLSCQQGQTCANWQAKPSDFIPLINTTRSKVMWTVNQNGTPEEAAALVAFFNGSTSDTRTIGTDRNGKNWKQVKDWAQLRVNAGYPSPVKVDYWEIGNEIYGGRQGKDCASFGWEDVWTCDGREYVNGLNQYEGLLDFATKMKSVDSSIKIGGVGVRDPASWSNFGNEVIEEAGNALDFYIVHHYEWNTPPSNTAQFLSNVTGTWKQPVQTLRNKLLSMTKIAVTEYNSAAFQAGDTSDMMSKAVNGIFIAETIGEFAENGVDMATHWDLAHGDSSSPASAYGLINSYTNQRTSQYWAMAFWTRMGSQLVDVSTQLNPANDVRVFATKEGSKVKLLILNKKNSVQPKTISVPGAISATQLESSTSNPSTNTVTINGNANPAIDIEQIPKRNLAVNNGVVNIDLGPTSISMVEIQL